MAERLTTFIPAGGLGSRLHPHTIETPKPMLLMGTANKRLIDHPLEISTGISDQVWVSVDYLAEIIEQHLEGKPKIKTLRDEKTVGSGGSLIEHYNTFSDLDSDGDLLVLPSDHIYDGDFNIEKYWNIHKESEADVTLLTVPNKQYGEFLVVDGDNALSIEGHTTPRTVSTTGTYMFRNGFILDILNKMRRRGEANLNIYKDIVCPSVGRVAVKSHFIGYEQGLWEDTGTPERFLQSNMRLNGGDNVISKEASIEESTHLRRCVVLGSAVLPSGLRIEDAIISGTSNGELLISRVESIRR
tara:strand:+ start:1141 stop:2040 length:900 start_codon:yes stop_codon:yes gene_type:complete